MHNIYDNIDERQNYKLTNWQLIWFCLVLLSFCYELTVLELFSADRANIRLFDIAFFLGVLTVYPNVRNRLSSKSKLYTTWRWIILVFAICAISWTPIFPWEYARVSLFYIYKYGQGLFVLYLITKIEITSKQKRLLHFCVIIGGIVVATYAIPEYLRGGTSERVAVAGADKVVKITEGALLSCLGPTYFHIAMFCPLASVMAISYSQSMKNVLAKYLILAIGIFVSWPAFFCGARTGIAAVAICWGCLFLFGKSSLKVSVVIVLLIASVLLYIKNPDILSLETFKRKSLTMQRIEHFESVGKNTLSERITLTFYKLSLYRWQGAAIPFIGAGLYIAPHTYASGYHYFRVDYGVHNLYLFAFEQGGLAAFILFFIFLFACRKSLKTMRKYYDNDTDKAFADGMYAFFYAIIIVGMAGQVFWMGFGTENFNAYLLILFALAIKPTLSESTAILSEDGVEMDYENYTAEVGY